MHGFRLRTLAASIALTLTGTAGAWAQASTSDTDAPPAKASKSGDATTKDGSGLEEVVVVARRREERIQDVPLAIAAFRPETLERQSIQTANDLERIVPGLNISNVSGGGGNVGFAWLRGVPGVVGYFAEVPTNLNGGAMYFDVDNVSVLKGPQGTLFGLSTNGGAILYTPTKPDGQFGGYVQGTVGDYGRMGLEAVVNAPIQDDRWRLRVGVKTYHVDGYQKDLSRNTKLGDDNEQMQRISLVFRPNQSFENDLIVNHYQSHSQGPTNVLVEVSPTAIANFIYGAPTMANLLRQQQQLGYYTVPGSAVPGGAIFRLDQTNVVNTTTWEINDRLTLKNILGYQKTQSYARQSFVNIPVSIYDIYNTSRPAQSSQTSEELQLQGRAMSDRLTYTVGTFHSWAYNVPAPGEYLGLQYRSILGNPSGTDTDKTALTHAIYGQGTYDLSSYLQGLSITAGLRKTWDTRSVGVTMLDVNQNILGKSFDSASWSALNYTWSLSWKANPDTLWYFTNSRGYSSGGFNNGPGTPAQYRVYNPETLTNFEFGVKSDWQLGGMRGRTNVSVFHAIYRDVQAPLLVPANGGGPGAFALVNANAAKGHIDGLDAEATLLPFSGFEISGNIAWLNAQYDSYLLPNGVDASTRRFVYVPRVKYGIRMSYRLPVNPAYGRFELASDYSRQTEVVQNANKNIPIPEDFVPGLSNLNLSLNWKGIAGRPDLDGTLFVNNAWNNKLGSGGIPLYDSIGTLSYSVAAPRMWGMRVRYSF
ncbi:MAG: TonB-dependent receptor plug domain-containing protein [Proteobacteria bacterium]|nr:TonB-dependent receptor plug domain-containing protein [Pseudomonadota bacterium]HQR04237.1 TonB-dependent receptor plug domain-containing protein [Rhodocyclaceae bacterium]